MLKKNRHLVPKDSPGERSVTEWSVPKTSELAQRNAIFFLPPCHYSKRRKSIAIWMAYKDPSLWRFLPARTGTGGRSFCLEQNFGRKDGPGKLMLI